jgi:hypothetical protein
VRTRQPAAATAARPNAAQWLWYAYGGRLPRRLSPWVLADLTRRSWILRHLARATVQLLPVLALVIVVAPIPLDYRISVAVGGLALGLGFSMAFMTETIEHRAAKAGYPAGTAAALRTERQEREHLERAARYRRGGAGSFD